MAMDLSRFDSRGFDRGASAPREALWLLVRSVVFLACPMPWYALRRALLRQFGARIGRGVVIKPQAKIAFPWKLEVGDHAWLGEESWILNLAPVTIGRDACVSQRAFLCAGNHDWTDPRFRLLAQPIRIGDGAWIGASAFVGPGVTVGNGAVATAGSVVTDDLPADMVCSGNPCRPVKRRGLKSG
jgi:putative colanic acid biosynthesis acetyltransferase WcaF